MKVQIIRYFGEVEKLKVNRIVIFGLLVVLGIHSLRLIVNPIFEEFFISLLEEYGPWFRLPLVVLEVYLIFFFIKRLSLNPDYIDNSKSLIILSLTTVALLFVSTFLVDSEPYPLVCGNTFFDADESKDYFLSRAYTSQQRLVVSKVENIIYGICIVYFTLVNMKKK